MSTPCENCGSDLRVCVDCDLYNGKYIEIPDNATNGDVMKIVFPKIGVYDEWYDEPYQKGGNSEYLGGELYQGEFENR